MKKSLSHLLIIYCIILSSPTIFAKHNIMPIDTISNNSNLYGINRMTDITSLPILDTNTRVHYEGSIDKQGKNADWNWSLYQDKKGEWVIFDVKGPGCIYNIVQHRYINSQEAIFRFYFDDEETPRFTIRSSDFGNKFPFIEPLASCYIGPLDNGRGPIRVVRSFIPMPFRKGCRITTNIKLEGFDRAKGEGGWGHVIYHTYNSSDTIQTFTGNEDYSSLVQLWKQTGSNPLLKKESTFQRYTEKTIQSGQQLILLDKHGQGCMNGIKLYFANRDKEYLQNVWIHMYWDQHNIPDISCPIGCLAGNSLGFNNTSYLLSGFNTDGWLYNYFPMPFWNHATIIIENRSSKEVVLTSSEITINKNSYKQSSCGYFRNTPYYFRKHTSGSDSPIGIIKGTGKMVAAHITCYGEHPNTITCEGDVRIHIDGNRTPQIESDGSESYICYGWGFPTPAETHPSGGYDGLPDNPWSMTRLCLGDSYPFYSELKFGIESGEYNNQYLEHSGTIFYYGQDEVTMIKTDSLDLNNTQSIINHDYHATGNVSTEYLETFFEGDADNVPISGKVYSFNGYSCFKINISPKNKGILLRRLSDQKYSQQAARVFVDGQEVTEHSWYVADSNPYKRWLEDDFDIPARFTSGKSSVSIRIIPINKENEDKRNWNEAGYQIFSYIK